jgi:hypothetical protein
MSTTFGYARVSTIDQDLSIQLANRRGKAATSNAYDNTVLRNEIDF